MQARLKFKIIFVTSIIISLTLFVFYRHIQSEKDSSFLRVNNPNSIVDAKKYKQHNARTLKDYKLLLGPGFSHHLTKTSDSALNLIDSGAGLGVAALQISNELQINVTAINAQDMWSKISCYIRRLEDPKRFSKCGISSTEVKSLTHIFSTSSGRMNLDSIIIKLMNIYKNQLNKNLFSYKVGYSEEVLDKMRNSSDIIIDVFGAFFYSPKRHFLLKQYYYALKPGGVAYVYVGGEPIHGISRQVKLKNGKSITLYRYLKNLYPTIFKPRNYHNITDYSQSSFESIYPKGVVLEIHKDSDIREINLRLKTTKVKVIKDLLDASYPILTVIEK
ncbi:MAG: hypothetical protein KC493_17260 [Bacteriovoracaceae bacterium]|nr:hypothetical protein [Bacteriovoracaceae bacterium]